MSLVIDSNRETFYFFHYIFYFRLRIYTGLQTEIFQDHMSNMTTRPGKETHNCHFPSMFNDYNILKAIVLILHSLLCKDTHSDLKEKKKFTSARITSRLLICKTILDILMR